jgi:radical SAM superfamily enzyme YgiQ (UPF0313 family)
MGRKALLVYPEMPPTYWSMRYALRFIGKKASLPPLGLVTVAALLPEDYEVTVVDMNVERLSEAMVAAADVVFTSSMVVQRESLESVIRLCAAHGTPVVAGGPYPTTSHEQIQGVDHFVLNEAEVTLPHFLADFERGRAERVYTDTARADLRQTPPPRFDLLDRRKYSSMALQYSRGCPHSCEFCSIVELFGHQPRTKSPAQLLGELTLLFDSGWRGSVFVVDDNFIGNQKEVKLLLPEIARWQRERDYPFSLFTESTLALAEDEQLMDAMVEAGFNMVFLGIETPDRNTLACVGKRQNLKSDMLESVHRIQAKGMEVSGGFVLGFDTDPVDIFDRQIRFIQEAAIPTAMVGLLTVLPETRLHRRLAAEARLTGDSAGNNTHDLRLNYVPKMGARQLLAGYKRVLAEIYKPNRYFERCLKLLRTLKVHRTSHRRVRLTELRAFVLSLVRQTFSSYSWSYWKFLVKGLLARPSMIAEAVTMAVKGHHYFKMTKSVLAVERFKRSLEELGNSFERMVADVSVNDLKGRLAELVAYRNRALARARKRYRRLNRDFRIYVEDAIADFEARTDELLAQFAARAAFGATA